MDWLIFRKRSGLKFFGSHANGCDFKVLIINHKNYEFSPLRLAFATPTDGFLVGVLLKGDRTASSSLFSNSFCIILILIIVLSNLKKN